MNGDAYTDLLSRQIQEAEGQLIAQRHRGENVSGAEALVRSLRYSLEACASGVDPDEEAASSCVLLVSGEGELHLRRDTRGVSISSAYLRTLLAQTGVSLEPEQWLLVEPLLARRLLEETLGEVAAEQFQFERKRGDLVQSQKEAVGASKEALDRELGELEDRLADLLIRKIELVELHLSAHEWLNEPCRVRLEPEKPGFRA
jgi:hypothetical protein